MFTVARDKKIIFWNTHDTEAIIVKDSNHSDIITDMILLNDKLSPPALTAISRFSDFYSRDS